VEHIDLYLVGPEMSGNCAIPCLGQGQGHGQGQGEGKGKKGGGASSSPTATSSTSMCITAYRGTTSAFFTAHTALLSTDANVFVVGCNCGFGNWENPMPIRFDLLDAWLKDLYFLTSLNIPIAFTCANDYADLTGETAIMQRLLGANFVIEPQENPFSYASTLVPPSANKDSDYSRGNSYIYGIQGSDRTRRRVVNFKEEKMTRIGQVVKTLNAVKEQPWFETWTTARLWKALPSTPTPTPTPTPAPAPALATTDISTSSSTTVFAVEDAVVASIAALDISESVQATPSPTPTPPTSTPPTAPTAISELPLTLVVKESSEGSVKYEFTNGLVGLAIRTRQHTTLDLSVGNQGRTVKFSLPGGQIEESPLPRAVIVSTVAAKFNKKKGTLTITATATEA